MGAFKINGGKKLQGDITPQGAKNEALQILSAVLLTDEKVTISNIPDIRDVNKLIEILADLGVKVEKLGKKNKKESETQPDENFASCLGALKIIKDGWETEAIPEFINKNSQKISLFSKIFGNR